MAEQGLHQISLEEYVLDPAPAPSLSASLAHTLLSRSPRHAWMAHPRLNPDYQHEEAEQMDIGTIAHALLLEHDSSRVVIVEAPDWLTKAAKGQRDQARADGKLPVLAHKMDAISAMVRVARNTIEQSELAGIFDDGQPEVTLIWKEGEIWCRARPDWLSRDRRILFDYKTTAASAEPNAWSRGLLLSMGYDLQAAIGLRGINALTTPPPRECSFVFMVQEIKPPYAVSFVGLSPEFEDFATKKFRAAVELWQTCLLNNVWPGYPTRIAWAEPPSFATFQWAERQLFHGQPEGRVEDL